MPIEKMIFQIFSAVITTCGFGLMMIGTAIAVGSGIALKLLLDLGGV